MQLEKITDFFEVCKCGMLCVNFNSVTVYNYSIVKFWPLPLKQRIELILII